VTAQEKVTELVRDRFESGEFVARRRIPSQAEMAEEFGVSRRLIAAVVRRLRDESYLWTLPHKGSYARPREDWRPL
jgi:DNA-binding FadR family transcriptional regulator